MITHFWDYQFVATDLSGLPMYIEEYRSDRNNVVHLVNTHMLSEAESNSNLKLNLKNSRFNLMDGMPIVQLKNWEDRKRYHRLAGLDVFWEIIRFAANHKKSVLLLGGSREDLELAKTKILNLHRLLDLDILDPGFIDLRDFDSKALIERCKSFDYVMVFLGCPKQEIVMSKLAEETSSCYFGLGGVLELVIGKKWRAPYLIRRLSLEWLFRLMQDPRRLMGRYAYHNFNFLFCHFLRMIR